MSNHHLLQVTTLCTSTAGCRNELGSAHTTLHTVFVCDTVAKLFKRSVYVASVAAGNALRERVVLTFLTRHSTPAHCASRSAGQLLDTTTCAARQHNVDAVQIAAATILFALCHDSHLEPGTVCSWWAINVRTHLIGSRDAVLCDTATELRIH